MTTYRRRLPGTYGRLTIVESVDADRAEVTYRVRAPRVTGAFVAVPAWTHFNSRDPLPDGLDLHLGTGPSYTSAERRENLPTVNGIPLVGCVMVDPVEWLSRAEPRYRFSRPTGLRTSRPAPDATNSLALAVVVQLLILWTSRPDRAELARTHAVRRAPARLAELRRGPIHSAETQIAKLTAELADHYRFAAALEPLAAEYEAMTSRKEGQ